MDTRQPVSVVPHFVQTGGSEAE